MAPEAARRGRGSGPSPQGCPGGEGEARPWPCWATTAAPRHHAHTRPVWPKCFPNKGGVVPGCCQRFMGGITARSSRPPTFPVLLTPRPQTPRGRNVGSPKPSQGGTLQRGDKEKLPGGGGKLLWGPPELGRDHIPQPPSTRSRRNDPKGEELGGRGKGAFLQGALSAPCRRPPAGAAPGGQEGIPNPLPNPTNRPLPAPSA